MKLSTFASVEKSPHRLARSRTQGFHPCNRGSNPLGDTKSKVPNLNEFGEPIPENRAENRRVEIIFQAR